MVYWFSLLSTNTGREMQRGGQREEGICEWGSWPMAYTGLKREITFSPRVFKAYRSPEGDCGKDSEMKPDG